MDFSFSSSVKSSAMSVESEKMVICGCNTFGWQYDKMQIIANNICTFFLVKNKLYNQYQLLSRDKIANTIKENVDVFCAQEIGGFHGLFFTNLYGRHYLEWTRKKYVEIISYLREIGEPEECISYYKKMEYQELLDICKGEVSLIHNNRCSLGILCGNETAVLGDDDVIDVTRSWFHRPTLGVKYRGLPIYTVHAPSSSNENAKKNYINKLVRALLDKHGEKWIAVGDFNYEPQYTKELLRSERLDNGTMLAQGAKVCHPTVATHNGGKVIDYAIHGNDVACSILGVVQTIGSDHSPVLYDVEFNT